jgi:hypothetical protein
MFSVGAFYFATCKKWKLMGLFLGLGLIVHMLAAFVTLIMLLAYKEFRTNWKALAVMCSLLVFYVYIPITNRPPYMWIPDPSTVNASLPPFLVSAYSFVADTASTIGFLIGKLSMYDTPKRILDIIGIVGVSIGVVTIIPIVYWFWKTKWYRNVLFWLIFTPTFIFLIELDPNTFDYTMLSIPFLAIATGLGMNKLIENKGLRYKTFAYVTTVILIGFGIFNCNYFDIGRTIDKNMSASNLYYNEFTKIPDGSIFMPNYCSDWEAIFKYNKDYNKNIIPVSIDVLPSKQYLKVLQAEHGVKLIEGTSNNLSLRARETAASIIELNNNVWTSISTDPSTFGTKVIPANHDTTLIDIYDVERMRELEANPTVKWIPYNPYDWFTTSICVSEWNYVLMSNHNISRLILYCTLAFALIYIFRVGLRNKKKTQHVK